MKVENCGVCRYGFRFRNNPHPSENGECRRYPPTTYHHRILYSTDSGETTLFLRRDAGDWCGEFFAKLSGEKGWKWKDLFRKG